MSLTVQPDCLKGRVVWRTVYGDMHLKDLLGSIAGYSIPVPDFYLVLHGLRCRKNTIMDKSINQSRESIKKDTLLLYVYSQIILMHHVKL